ncbi:hypothetical protein DN051_20465 [Streptomyces cadmiisoli]|uniref:Secreted protein n=1 Tax=Streptomyces cadmiisoli TaxID=2184053 RepID=A0A2Z4JBS9_9ACTN|nr:hypothetical protein DN051_20465 [Streptomyces cadmiisoli]
MIVLLLVLLVPGAHAAAVAVPVPVAGEVAEVDLLDTALRPPHRAGKQPAVPRRPVRPAAPPPHGTPVRPCPAPTWPPYTPRALRSVVLRC